MMLLLVFFFNKNIICMLSISVFIASTSSSIIKSKMCFFPCWKVSIFHSVSTALFLSLNVVFTSLININLSQSWILFSSFIWSIFFYTYILATPPLSQANTAVLLSVAVTLLLLKNKQIPFYQFLDFVWLLLNHPLLWTKVLRVGQ